MSDAVQQQLTESHIQSFTDLTDAERTLFIDKAAKTIHGGISESQTFQIIFTFSLNLTSGMDTTEGFFFCIVIFRLRLPTSYIFVIMHFKNLGDFYMQLYGQVSKVLDQHLNNQVAKELLEDFPVATKSDLILEGAQVHGVLGPPFGFDQNQQSIFFKN